MRTRVETQAETEIIQFLARNPSPDQIIAFHPSSAVEDRAYELVEAERERELTEEEERELETYLYLEHFMRMLKAETHLQLEKRPA